MSAGVFVCGRNLESGNRTRMRGMAGLMVCQEAKIVLNGVLVDLHNGAGAGNRMK